MKKTSSGAAGSKVRELEAFDKRRINLSQFKPDLSAKDLKALFGLVGGTLVFPQLPFLPIETLSVTKTVGRGRTNLTLVRPTTVQTDALVPRAFFDRRTTPSRNPAIQMHFLPGAYGITSVASYIMEFTIETFDQANFRLAGFAGGGPLESSLQLPAGKRRVSLVMKDVPPSEETFGFLEQTAGGRWEWFFTQVSFPPLVITQ